MKISFSLRLSVRLNVPSYVFAISLSSCSVFVSIQTSVSSSPFVCLSLRCFDFVFLSAFLLRPFILLSLFLRLCVCVLYFKCLCLSLPSYSLFLFLLVSISLKGRNRSIVVQKPNALCRLTSEPADKTTTCFNKTSQSQWPAPSLTLPYLPLPLPSRHASCLLLSSSLLVVARQLQ